MRRRVKGTSETLAVQVANAVSRLRSSDVQKPPGIAEAIDWVAALSLLGVERLDVATVDRTLGSVLKYSDDQEVVRAAGLELLVPGAMTDGRAERRARSRDDPARPSAARDGVEPAPARSRPPGHSRPLGRLREALALVRPITRRRLYWTARAVFVSDPALAAAFDAVFFSIFGGRPDEDFEPDDVRSAGSSPNERPRSELVRRVDRQDSSASLRSSTVATATRR